MRISQNLLNGLVLTLSSYQEITQCVRWQNGPSIESVTSSRNMESVLSTVFFSEGVKQS